MEFINLKQIKKRMLGKLMRFANEENAGEIFIDELNCQNILKDTHVAGRVRFTVNESDRLVITYKDGTVLEEVEADPKYLEFCEFDTIVSRTVKKRKVPHFVLEEKKYMGEYSPPHYSFTFTLGDTPMQFVFTGERYMVLTDCILLDATFSTFDELKIHFKTTIIMLMQPAAQYQN